MSEVVEVACDESGSDGENLMGGNTDVFAHAGVVSATGPAADALREIRRRVRSPAVEYKANHLLREKHRAVLEWLLAPSGPLHGQAHVHLTDKAYFGLGRVADLLTEDAQAVAATLYREGPRTFGPGPWATFLWAANDLMRTPPHGLDAPATTDPERYAPVEAFCRIAAALRHGVPADHPAGAALDQLLREARPRAEAFRARTLAHPPVVPALDPLLPAIVRTVAHWSADGHPVAIVHDEQNALTPERIAWLRQECGPRRLTGLRRVNSLADPRVQLADFLAGVARKIASDALGGQGDPVLVELLSPYVDASSVWADGAGSVLSPAP